MRAANRLTGLRLSADEVLQLAGDDAIETVGCLDLSAWEDEQGGSAEAARDAMSWMDEVLAASIKQKPSPAIHCEDCGTISMGAGMDEAKECPDCGAADKLTHLGVLTSLEYEDFSEEQADNGD